MTRILVLICTMLAGVGLYAQEPKIQVQIVGDVTVTTSDSLTLTAVRVKGHMWRDGVGSAEHDLVFCITHVKPLPSKLNYAGGGRVVYRTPRKGNSAAKGPRAEKMLPALAVLQADGESRFFLAEGQAYPFPPNERSVGKFSTFAVVDVVRHDSRDPNGKRQKERRIAMPRKHALTITTKRGSRD